MKHSRLFQIAGLLAFFAASCGDADDNEAPGEARELLASVRAARYPEWTRAPGYPGREPSRTAHGVAVEIFINEVVEDALVTAGLTAWPEGSIIVKEGFHSDGSLALIAVMERRPEGWFWAEFDAAGAPEFSGAPSICTGCHASGADSVRAFGFGAR